VANVGLVLGGGGARAAYQVGAIGALAEILDTRASPFRVLAGLSAGAINCIAVGVGADDLPDAADRLTQVWMSLTPESVYRTDFPKLASLGLRWMKDLGTGAAFGRSRATHLLDTEPLRELLTRTLDVARLSTHFQSGLLRGVAISATNYLTGSTVSFFDGAPALKPWIRQGRVAVRERLGIEHVMASAAIPLFFPPVLLDGKFYGDGGVRMTTPTSPAIHLGAEKILAIGIHHHRPAGDTIELNRDTRAESVSISEIAGVLLNAVFLDSLDNDIERLERINRTLGFVAESDRQKLPDKLRRIPCLSLRPSQDLGRLAAGQYEKFPSMLRHLLRGIGVSGDAGWDLMSYLAFQPEYIGFLIALGRADTLARRREIEAFFEMPTEDVAPPSVLPASLRS
jgi:NTE family protein